LRMGPPPRARRRQPARPRPPPLRLPPLPRRTRARCATCHPPSPTSPAGPWSCARRRRPPTPVRTPTRRPSRRRPAWAGVGRRRRARRVAGTLAAAYPDGQLFVDLRGTDDEPVSGPQALARLLGLLGVPAGQVPPEPDNQIDLFRTLVTHRRILLLLDNA